MCVEFVIHVPKPIAKTIPWFLKTIGKPIGKSVYALKL
jgi:hypothetical protein